MENESPFHSEILYLGSHRCCSFILLSLHLQDGTAIVYYCDLCLVHVLSSLLCFISSGVLVPDICQEEDPEGLPVLLSYYLLDPGSPGSSYSLSLSPVACPARTQAPPARARPGGSSPPCLPCSYPRSGQATSAWTELGGLSWP